MDFKGAHVEKAIILTCVRWYVAYPLSDRPLEELMEERGGAVDHATINRWVLQYSPPLEDAFHRRKPPVWMSWRMDEPSIRVCGPWRDVDRAVEKTGHTIDWLLTEYRDERAAMPFLTKALRRHRRPGTITIDGSEAHASAIRSDTPEHGTAIAIRQVKDRNTVVEQDPRVVKRVTRLMLGFTSFEAAQGTLAGIERMPMPKKGPMVGAVGAEGFPAAEQCYARAASSPDAQTSHDPR